MLQKKNFHPLDFSGFTNTKITITKPLLVRPHLSLRLLGLF